MNIEQSAISARNASIALAAIDSVSKNRALKAIADALSANAPRIIQANRQDLAAAQKNNLPAPLLKRLNFDNSQIQNVCTGIESLINIEDPVGKTLTATQLDTGLDLYKVACPIGVIGVVFESRPDALVQISTLCLKSGNAVLLKGGSEAAATNTILADLINKASTEAGIPHGWLSLLETRLDVQAMLKMSDYIDLLIPRGSNEFVKYIMNNTTIPVLGHADGICHIYIDGQADIGMAVKISVDGKCQYCAACNAAETLLVHRDIAEAFLPTLADAFSQKGVELRGCPATCRIIQAKPATEKDFGIEYLDYIISVKVVSGVDEAIEHINRYGSGHTDTIVTNNRDTAAKFLELVDSACVFWNCSTRFSDGYRFGLGAEVGISTNKIHARGPVGLEGLLTYKWLLIGSGQIVADYTGPNAKQFIHKKMSKEYGPQ